MGVLINKPLLSGLIEWGEENSYVILKQRQTPTIAEYGHTDTWKSGINKITKSEQI